MGKYFFRCFTSSTELASIGETTPFRYSGTGRLVIQEAANGLRGRSGYGPQLWFECRAGVWHDVRAARIEQAPGGSIVRMRNGSTDRRESCARLGSQSGDRAPQRLVVRV